VTFNYQVEREDDGRWIAEILELPGCLAYGLSRDDALRAVQVLAFCVLADRMEHDEHSVAVPSVAFVEAA
jgi:predicted RNase H-like HicB family nuclease